MAPPAAATQTTRRPANLIGDGFYGVDLKSGPDGPMVIEVNDNPNLERGVEDEADRDVWNKLTEWFVKRLNA